MSFIIGTTLFGKVDEIPEVGHVATVFFHVCFIPLVPMQTWFILEDQEGAPLVGWNGAKIESCGKSIGRAYLRSLLFWATLYFALSAVPGLSEGIGETILRSLAAATCLGLLWFSYSSNKATLGRALGVAERARIPRAVVKAKYGDRSRGRASMDPPLHGCVVGRAQPGDTERQEDLR